MADLASLGLAVDLSQLDAADKALGKFAQSGKTAQISADVLVASAVRLGISVEEVQRRLAAANDNLAANTEQAIKLADATKLAVAANDNFSRSITAAGGAADKAGDGFFAAAENALTLVGHLKLLALGAYALFPAFRGVVNSGIQQALVQIIPVAGLAGKALSGIVSALGPMISFFGRIGGPIAIAVVAFQFLHSVWNKGVELLDQYKNSLRSLYSEDTVQNLEKLTKNQKDIITAEQVARATELGVRLEDAQFTIDRILHTSFDLTDPALKLQAIWVAIKEGIAAGLQSIVAMPDAIDRAAKAFGNSSIWDKISGRAPGSMVNLTPGEESPQTANASLQAATNRLSALMGVAALAGESLNRAKGALGDLTEEAKIGDSFIAKFSDSIKKLSEPQTTDGWNRAVVSINRHTAALIANSESVGQTINFQEQLRVETRLLEATKGGLNAATDDQIAKYAELRAQGIEPTTAAMQAGIRIDKERIKTMTDLAQAAGEARQQLAQETFAIANQRAMDADKISTRALTAFSAAQKGDIAAAQKRLELQNDLIKGAATQEQVDERAASARKLAMDTEIKQLSEAARARALSATQTIATAQVSIDAIGKSVGETYRLTTIEQTRQQLEQDASARRTTINQKELADLTEKINKTAQLKQIEAEASALRNAAFELQTVFMSDLDKQIAALQRSLHGDNWRSFMNDGLAANMRITDALRDVKLGFEDVGKSIFSAFLSGKNVMDAMVRSLDNIAKKLADKAFENILMGVMSGNPLQAGMGIAQAGVSALISLFTGDQEAKKKREEAEAAWRKMADQVTAFNNAAAGFDLGPLTNELNSLRSTFETLRRAADEAGDAAGAARLNDAFMAGTRRIVDEFKSNAEELSPLQTAIRAVNDEYRGLVETLNSLNYGSLTIGLDEAAAAQIKQIIGKYTTQLNQSLEERLNSATGKSFLNDAIALMRQRQADLALAAELGNDPAVLAQITAVFHAGAQKIVNDAGLVGDSFNDFINQFPELAGVVVQANEDMTASAKALADQMNASAKSITDYVNGLFAGSGSTLSPTAQLAAAQSTYNAKLVLAQGGNIDALNSITQDAENLRQAARSVYASGSGYQAIFSQITSQLLGLPAVQNTSNSVVAAVRDSITAIQAVTAATNNVAGIQSGSLLPAINAGNAASIANALVAYFNQIDPTGKLAQIITTTQSTNINAGAAASAGQSTANLTATSLETLTAIKSLNQTSATQLTLLQQALAPSSIAVTVPNLGTAAKNAIGTTNSSFTLQNQMVVALNKIVYNTASIVRNTWAVTTSQTGRGDAIDTGLYAAGGWISGGTPGIDSVRLGSGGLGMPGEFVIRNAVAQANASWLPAFNRTGQMPSNDNGGVIAELRMLRASNEMMQRQIAQMVYDAGEKSASATRFSGEELRSEMRMRKRDQRTA